MPKKKKRKSKRCAWGFGQSGSILSQNECDDEVVRAACQLEARRRKARNQRNAP